MLTRVWFYLTQGTVAQHSLRGPYALGFLAFTIGSAYAKAPFLHERQATSMKHVSKEQGAWHGLRVSPGGSPYAILTRMLTRIFASSPKIWDFLVGSLLSTCFTLSGCLFFRYGRLRLQGAAKELKN